MSSNESWSLCLTRLEADLGPEDLQMYVRPLQVVERENGLLLLAPNSFVADSVRQRFWPVIEARFRSIDPAMPLRLEVGTLPRALPRVAPTSAPTAAPGVASSRASFDPEFESNLDSHYSFDNFVEGKSNELGRAAAFQVAMNPGRSYNPLVLYGGTGLGKTHLMHAAGNLMRERNPSTRVLYQRSEQFFSAMVRALSNKVAGSQAMDEFKRRYREVDALLIDDIQFFAGKDRTQEEFFHTFNALLEGKQQIILTCDRYPKEVEKLEPRLSSRLGWGLPVAIEPPDYETRFAILLAKAADRGMDLPDDVAQLIASKMRSNVRDLEGALNSLIARATFSGRAITREFATETLRDLLTVQDRTLSLSNIQRVVAEYFQLRLSDLLSKRRTRNLARPRQIAMALAKELTDLSLPEIGDGFGGRDHTTVLHACRQVRELVSTDGRIREDWEKLLRVLTT